MQFSHSFEQSIWDTDGFQGREFASLDVAVDANETTLTLDTERLASDKSLKDATTVEVELLNTSELHELSKMLCDWCVAEDLAVNTFETSFVDGEFTTEGEKQEISRLQFEISEEGLLVIPLNGDTEVGESLIPSSKKVIEGSDGASHEHLYELDFLLHMAIRCSEYPTEARRALDHMGEFTGPIHHRLSPKCVSQYYAGDYGDAIAQAGQGLEKEIRSRFDANPDERFENLLGKLFSSDDPSLLASEDENKQEKVRDLFQSTNGALRNPFTHNDPDAVDHTYLKPFSKRHARDVLFLYDFLHLLVEQMDTSEG
ncbi:TIGR02391 family protein [Haloferax sp. DFSO60]|uniref:TIGR02391 family protein n=1 Tax=Haloferax sp. DFSO60 TaxID=3388652 RepID=UPI00397C1792